MVTIVRKKPKKESGISLAAQFPVVAGRPLKPLDPEQLMKVAELGCTVEEAASFFQVSVATMYRRLRQPEYRNAWDTGWDMVKMSLRRKQLELALDGNVTLLIWLGKNKLGQSDKVNVDTTTRMLDPSALETETVPIAWNEDMENELKDINRMIEISSDDYEEVE